MCAETVGAGVDVACQIDTAVYPRERSLWAAPFATVLRLRVYYAYVYIARTTGTALGIMPDLVQHYPSMSRMMPGTGVDN